MSALIEPVVTLWAIALFAAAVWVMIALMTMSVTQNVANADDFDRQVVNGARRWVPLLVLTGPFALAWLGWRMYLHNVHPLVARLIKGNI